MRVGDTELSVVKVAQVLVRVLVLVDRIIDALTVKEVVVHLHVLISRGHALGPTSTRGATPALVRDVANGVGARVMLSEICFKNCPIRGAFHVEEKVLFMLILHLILLASLPTGDKSVTVVLAGIVLS